jgi:4-methyl-5(b-hydroxyethyl)-thiazole monophosphate biosynthesis
MPDPVVLVPVADGSEEIETVCIVDTLRRAGVAVTLAAAGSDLAVTCSRGVRLLADARLDDLHGRTFDAIAVPGGMPGAEHLAGSATLCALLEAQAARDATIGAICAAPAVVLQPLGLLDGRAATCHPAFLDRLDRRHRREDRVVIDGPIVTSRGPGTAIEFALALVGVLRGGEVRDEVAGPMLVRE